MSVPIERNTAGQIIYVSLFDGADIVMTPTIADGDIQISLDGGAFNPPATLPSATPAASGQVQIPLAQAETNAVHIGIRGIDQVGAQWDDFYYSIFTDTGTIGELGTILSGITSLADWLGALAGMTADAPTLAEINATTAGTNYDNTTDSLEALADTKAEPGDAMDLVAGAVDATAVAASGAGEIADAVWDETLADHLAAGSTGEALSDCADIPGPGAVEWPYLVTNGTTGNPEPGVSVRISTDGVYPPTNVFWAGTTDVFGYARDLDGNSPWLTVGTYYFWLYKVGFSDPTIPDVEVVP